MVKSIFYAIILAISYFVFNKSLELFFVNNLLYEIGDSALFIIPLIYLITITIATFFLRNLKSYDTKEKSVNLRFLFFIILVALLLRISEDPLWNIQILLGKIIIPKNINIEFKSIELMNILSLVILGSILEEIFFRKIMLNLFAPKFLVQGIIISSMLFGFIHFKYPYDNYISVSLSIIFGLITSLLYLYKGLIYSIIFHIFYNVIWLIIHTYQNQYWNLITKLDFGYIYWAIVIISFLFVLIFMRKLIISNQLEYTDVITLINKKNY